MTHLAQKIMQRKLILVAIMAVRFSSYS
ncbi:unnamed protein product [Linum tenue]|uniref:Uncharacterized protein n=2 Tax=Linum tenue TaxID=586396 RepID=A0AAV0GQ25_9ROSI|nr:unnamed protein product [Linum tenue]